MLERVRPRYRFAVLASASLSVTIRNKERYCTDDHCEHSLLSEHEEVFSACPLYALYSRCFGAAFRHHHHHRRYHHHVIVIRHHHHHYHQQQALVAVR